MPSIFLSHCHSDKTLARKLARQLESNDIEVWIDEAEILVGDSLIEKISEGIDEMDFLGVLLSPESAKSEWVKKEVDIAMNHEIEGKRVKVLPLIVADCELPGFLQGKKNLRFTAEEEFESSFGELMRKLNSSASPPRGVSALAKAEWNAHTGRGDLPAMMNSLRERTEMCIATPDFENAVMVCLETRAAFSCFYMYSLSNPEDAMRQAAELKELLVFAKSAIEVIDIEGAKGENRLQLEFFIQNIDERISVASLVGEGRSAAEVRQNLRERYERIV